MEACSPAKGVESHCCLKSSMYAGCVENTIKDAFDIIGCDCVTSNLLDCVVSDMYGCYRDTLMVADLDCASCIDADILCCPANDSSSDVSHKPSSALCSDDDCLFPGSTGINLLVAEDDYESVAMDSIGASLPFRGPGCVPMNLSMQIPSRTLPPVRSTSPMTSESDRYSMESAMASGATLQQVSRQHSKLSGSDWVQCCSGPASPLSPVATLSAASSMASLSTMVHLGGSCSPKTSEQHVDNLQQVAERLSGVNMPPYAAVPCSQPQALAEAAEPGPQQLGGFMSAASRGEAVAALASLAAGRRAVVRPRRSASFVPTDLVGNRGKKRGSAANQTCKVAPNPDGHSCTACGAQSTPVWRAGPFGPKTLCNACGVRYMKVAKKK